VSKSQFVTADSCWLVSVVGNCVSHDRALESKFYKNYYYGVILLIVARSI